MSFKHITSRDNAVFKHLKKLADNKRERNKEGKTLLDGVHPVSYTHLTLPTIYSV